MSTSTAISPSPTPEGSATATGWSGFGWAINDCITMIGRSVKHVFRNVDGMLMAIVLPIMLMLVFVYVFGGGMITGTENYVDYVVPGVILLCTGFNAANIAIAVTSDMTAGVIDRFRSMPIASASVLVGHVVGSLLRNLLSTTLVVGVALLVGWRPTATPGEWLAATGLVIGFILAMSWVGAAAGLLASSPEAAGAFSFFMLFLPYVSSAFLPTWTMPSWLQAFADNQPLTSITETLRGLLMGTAIGDVAWTAMAWIVGIAVVGAIAASVLFTRRTAR